MQSRYRILTVFVAAAITFGSLLVFLGPQRFEKNIHSGRHDCAQPKTDEAKREE